MRLGPGTHSGSPRRGHSLRYQLGSGRDGSGRAGQPPGRPGVPNSPRVAGQVLESLGLQRDRLLQTLQADPARRGFQLLVLTRGTRVWRGRRTGWQKALRVPRQGPRASPPARGRRPATPHPASANEPRPFVWAPVGRCPSSSPRPQGPPTLTFLPLLRRPVHTCCHRGGFAVLVLLPLLLLPGILLLLKLLRVPLEIPEPGVILVPADTPLSHLSRSSAPTPSTRPQPLSDHPAAGLHPARGRTRTPSPRVPVPVQQLAGVVGQVHQGLFHLLLQLLVDALSIVQVPLPVPVDRQVGHPHLQHPCKRHGVGAPTARSSEELDVCWRGFDCARHKHALQHRVFT